MKKSLILTALAATIAAVPLIAQETIVREVTPVQPTTTVQATTTTQKPTEIVGIVTELVPDALVVRTKETTTPVRYTFSNTTEYVDELGNRVTRESIKTGVPVTVRYIQEGDRMVVNRVVVRQVAPPPAVIVEKPVTVQKPPVTIERKTTTTTTTKEAKEEEDDD